MSSISVKFDIKIAASKVDFQILNLGFLNILSFVQKVHRKKVLWSLINPGKVLGLDWVFVLRTINENIIIDHQHNIFIHLDICCDHQREGAPLAQLAEPVFCDSKVAWSNASGVNIS